MFNKTDISEAILILNVWRKFKLSELAETMHQKGDDAVFIELLNKIRTDTTKDSISETLKPRLTQQIYNPYSYHALYIFPENNPANRKNAFILMFFPDRLLSAPPKKKFLKTAA